MHDHDEDLINGAFSAFTSAAAPSVRASGAGAVRHTVKRRRTRTTLSLGVLAALLVVPVTAYAMTDRGNQGPPPVATSPEMTVSPSTSPSPVEPSTSPSPSVSASPAAPLLGPLGYGPLVLGQSLSDAAKTGLINVVRTDTDGSCLPVAKFKDSGEFLFFSDQRGLEAIYAGPGVKTPEGIGIGSTYEQVHAAYPAWKQITNGPEGTNGRGPVDVPGNPDAQYRIVVHEGKVVQLSIQFTHQGCYE